MFKYFINCLCVLLFVFMLDYLLYIKDYNEVLVASNYLKYDIAYKNVLEEINTNSYDIKISVEGNKISYCIMVERETLLNIKIFKKIEYNGTVE